MKAYPYMHKHPTSGQTTISEGMELRDWFAGLVLPEIIKEFDKQDAYKLSNVAYLAYGYADEMMKQREIKDVPNE